MATYAEIEKERLTKKKYVIYDFFDPRDPEIPDEFNIKGLWCKYLVDSPIKGGLDRYETIKKRMQEYDLYSGNGNPQFKNIESQLKRLNYQATDYFKRLCTLNIRNDESCRLMLIAGARIDYDTLSKDIEQTKGNPIEISKILHTLTGQVHAAALNGSFTKFFSTIYAAQQNKLNSKEYMEIDGVIMDFYLKTINGGSNIKKPIEIPTEPNIIFATPNLLYENMKEAPKNGPIDITQVIKNQIKDITTKRLNIEKRV